MSKSLAATVVAALSVLIFTTAAEAQLVSSCLRPFAIPDKWVEHQGSPSTFDPGGVNPDVYVPELGYNPTDDDGRYVTFYQGSTLDSLLSSAMFLPVSLGGSYGSVAYRDHIVSCVGTRYATGDLLVPENGGTGPLKAGMSDLIARDPTATWDPLLKAVVASAFPTSPRVIQLPVFDPAEYVSELQTGTRTVRIVKIVALFVDSMSLDGAIHGYLTARGRLTASRSGVTAGETAALTATIDMPAGPIGGVPIQFDLFNQNAGQVTTIDSDPHVTATGPVASIAPGTYPAAIRARLGDGAGFLRADESAADLIVTDGAQTPQVTWPAPNPIVYGTPLGPSQLNATADVPGQFFYSPAAATVLHSGTRGLSVTFVPDDLQQSTEVTMSVAIAVLPTPLTLRVAPSSKLYLDPLPPFALIPDGFVNGDSLGSLSGAAVFQTAATATSPVATYQVSASGLTSPDYSIQYQPGTLSILPRPVATLVYPVNGGTDVDPTQSITWTNVNADGYYLYVGTTLGAKDIVNTGVTHETSYRVPLGLPGGITLYARIWTWTAGAWSYVDSSFSAPAVARFLYPVSGATVTDPTKPMTWNLVPIAQAYYLYVGSTPGAKDLVDTGEIQQTSYVIRTGALPVNQLLYARLWTKAGGNWRWTDGTFTLVPLVAVLTFPVNSATNVDTTLPFQWTGVANVQAYYLYVGSTPGAKDLVNSGELQQTSYLVRTLPLSQLVYARLWTKIAGVWRYTDSSFSAMPAIARFIYPAAPGTTIDSSQPLTWTSVANVQAYYLYVGSTPGAKDLVNTGEIQQTSYQLRGGLPANQLVYGRLWTKVNNIWRYVDTTFMLP